MSNTGFQFGQDELESPLAHSHETLLKEVVASDQNFGEIKPSWLESGTNIMNVVMGAWEKRELKTQNK